MNTGEDLDVNQKAGWLNLSLASNYSGDSGSQSTPTKSSMKVYTCSFCKRKFEKAQALGGHQNGHRRERDAARRYLISNVTKFPLIHMHSLPGTVGETSTTSTIARFTDNGSGNGDICRQTHGAEESSVDLMMKWIGGVYSNDQPECRKSDPISLDLTLKL